MPVHTLAAEDCSGGSTHDLGSGLAQAFPAVLWGVALVVPARRIVHPPFEPENIPVLLMGVGSWITAGNKAGLLDGAWILLSVALRCVEEVQTMALAGSSNPELPPMVSLPCGRRLLLKLKFFHIWSSCTVNHKSFSCTSGKRAHTWLSQRYPALFHLEVTVLGMAFLLYCVSVSPIIWGLFCRIILSLIV